jgi:tetratricopeptide (TPR) repeat protein
MEAYRALDVEGRDAPPSPEELEAMLRKDPEDPLPHLLLADQARRAGDRTREIEALSTAIRLRPGVPRLRLARADAYLRSGFPDAAIDDATEAVRHGVAPAEAAPLLARANLAGPAPDPTLALVALSSAPADPALLPVRVRALALLDQPEQAIALVGRAMPRITGADLTLAVATELAGIPTPDAMALAKRLVGKVLAEDPKHPRARFLLALLADRWEDIEALLADDPGNAPARRCLFERFLSKDPDRARALAKGATDRVTARYLTGRLALLDDDPAAAVEAFRAVLADEPRDREAAEGLRAALERADPTAEEARLVERLREAEADVAAERYAELLAKIRRWQAEAIDAGPVGRPSEVASKILYQGAVAAEELRDLERAKDLYRASIRQRPDHFAALNNLALLLAGEPGSADRAVGLASRAARLAPGVAEVLDTLGTARLAAGDADGAVAAYRIAVARFGERKAAGDRGRARTLVRLARAYRESGRAAAAEEALRQALAADPGVKDSADWPQEE